MTLFVAEMTLEIETDGTPVVVVPGIRRVISSVDVQHASQRLIDAMLQDFDQQVADRTRPPYKSLTVTIDRIKEATHA